MNKKLIIILLLGGIILTPFFANLAVAATPGPIETILKLFADNLGFLFKPGMISQLRSGEEGAIIYVKVLFGMLITLPLYYLLRLGFGEKNKGLAGIIAAVIAIISLIVIPGKTIFTLATTYGAVATVILYLIPVGAVYFFYMFLKKNVESKSRMAGYIIELATMIIGIGYTTQVQKAMQELGKEQPIVQTLIDNQWLALIYGVFIFFALYILYKMITYGRANPDTIRGKRMFGTGGDSGLGGGLGGSGSTGGIPGTPAPGASFVTDAQKIAGNIETLETDLLSHVENAKKLKDAELQQFPGLSAAIPALADGIDALALIKDGYEKYALATAPEPEKTNKLKGIKNNFDAKKAEINANLKRVQDGLDFIKNAEKSNAITVGAIKRDLFDITNTYIPVIRVEITDVINELNKAKTDNNAKRTPANAQDIDDANTQIDLVIGNLRLTEANGLANFISAVATSEITAGNLLARIANFEKAVDGNINKLTSSINLIANPTASVSDFKTSSAYVRTINPDLAAREKETVDSKAKLDTIKATKIQFNNFSNELINKILPDLAKFNYFRK